MTAYFKVKKEKDSSERIMVVKNVGGPAAALDCARILKAKHVHSAKLIGIDDYELVYTMGEIFNEKNLLGKRDLFPRTCDDE